MEMNHMADSSADGFGAGRFFEHKNKRGISIDFHPLDIPLPNCLTTGPIVQVCLYIRLSGRTVRCKPLMLDLQGNVARFHTIAAFNKSAANQIVTTATGHV